MAKITLDIDPKVLAHFRQRLMLRRISGNEVTPMDLAWARVIEALDAGKSEYELKFKRDPEG